MKRIITFLELVAMLSYCSPAYRLTYLCCELTAGSCSAHATAVPGCCLSKAAWGYSASGQNLALLLVKLHEVYVRQIPNLSSIFQYINSLAHRGILSNYQGCLKRYWTSAPSVTLPSTPLLTTLQMNMSNWVQWSSQFKPPNSPFTSLILPLVRKKTLW